MTEKQIATEWADALLREFNGLPVITKASPERLFAVTGHPTPVRCITVLDEAIRQTLLVELEQRPVIENWRTLEAYVRAKAAHRLHESMHVLHLNAKNFLIRDECISEGSLDQTTLHVREVARRSLELGSASIILVHNHPSGDPFPSREDCDMTKFVVKALRPFGTKVYDHVIVGANGTTSLRALGYL